MTYLTPAQRAMLEATLYNLCFDMDSIGNEAEDFELIAALSDSELEENINEWLSVA